MLQLDGNAAGGTLLEVFGRDVTIAHATCLGCGATDSIGALMLYGHDMGVVLRCPSCGSVVLRASRTPTHVWLDATGARSIAIPMS
jgi:Family of unknown function (DUF6510)